MLKQAVRYGLVGASNTATDIAIFSVLVYGFAVPLLIGNTIAFSCAVVQSYWLNRKWTFPQTNPSASSTQGRRQFVMFCMSSFIGLCISNVCVVTLAPLITPIGGKLVATAATFVWGFSVSKWLIFRNN